MLAAPAALPAQLADGRGYPCPVRPITFWTFVAVAMFAAMTALWAFGDEPTGAVFVISAVLYWGSGITLIFLGLVAISRRWQPRTNERRRRPTADRPRT